MAQLGYKPSGNARGVGDMLDGQARATFLGSFSSATWVTEVGVRCGRNTATNGIVAPVFHDQASANSAPTTLAYSPTPKTVSTPMNLTVPDPATGVNLTWAGITDVLMAAGRTLGGGIWADPAGGSVGYGQGPAIRMYRDQSAPTVPDPFNDDFNSTEGQIDVWMIGTTNRDPHAPTIIAPPANGTVVDPTPDVTIGFSDPDTGLGDFISAYQIQVWNVGKTATLHDSDKIPTTGPQQTAGTVTHTVTDALGAGDYWVRAYTWDAADYRSPAREWRITVNNGGQYVMQPGDVLGSVGTHPSGLAVLNDTTPTLQATWSHDSGLDADSTTVSIKRIALDSLSDGTSVGDVTEALLWAFAGDYRTPYTSATNVADDGPFTFDFTDPAVDWAALESGAFVYRFGLAGTDTLGSDSFAVSERFIVNAAPDAVLDSPADDATVAVRPALQATVLDPGDGAGTHTVTFAVKKGVDSPVLYTGTHIGNNVYQLQTTSTHLPALDDYQWWVLPADPWGLGGLTTAHDLHYVAPPDITVTNPVDDSTITTGTPTVTATVDRTITHQRVIIRAQGGTQVYYDSLEQTASGSAVSQAVPEATLTNATDYDLEIFIRAADGLEATETTQFRLEYIPDPPMTNVTGTAVASSIFDTGAHPQFPNVEFVWDIVSTLTVSEEDWLGYVVTWEADGYDTVVWRVLDRNQPGMTDTRVPGGVAGVYSVQYERFVNAGFDTIRSEAVELPLSVDIQHMLITSEHPDDPAVTMRTGEGREFDITPQKAYVEILGQEYPDEWSSIAVNEEFSADLDFYDDATGAWTAMDAVAALQTLAKAVRQVDAEGRTYHAPRTLYLRTPRNDDMRLSLSNVRLINRPLRSMARVAVRGRRVSEGMAT